MEKKRRDVAVVGTGMAGLVTAHLLHNDPMQRFRVRVMDQRSEVSLAAESIQFPSTRPDQAKSTWVDVPMRAFAGGFYDQLVRMYDYLGVRYETQPFLFHFARLPGGKVDPNDGDGDGQLVSPPEPFLSHASNFHRIPPIPYGDILPWLLRVVYVVVCYAWFTACCFLIPPLPRDALGKNEDESLEHYLRRIHLPRGYVTNYLLPMISSVCTCSHSELLNFPASDVLTYKRQSHGQPHFVVSGGVHHAQDALLLRGVDVRLGVQSTKVTTAPDGGVFLTTRSSDTALEITERFDIVVLAVTPDAAASLFEPCRATLTQVPTTIARTVAHTDLTNIHPTSSSMSSSSSLKPNQPLSVSQQIFFRSSNTITEAVHAQHPILVTTNPLTAINPAKILRSASFTRVLRSPRSRRLLREMFRETEPTGKYSSSSWRNGDDGVYLAGGWCWDGMVLLEGCVVSAMRVATDLGVEVPWRT